LIFVGAAYNGYKVGSLGNGAPMKHFRTYSRHFNSFLNSLKSIF